MKPPDSVGKKNETDGTRQRGIFWKLHEGANEISRQTNRQFHSVFTWNCTTIKIKNKGWFPLKPPFLHKIDHKISCLYQSLTYRAYIMNITQPNQHILSRPKVKHMVTLPNLEWPMVNNIQEFHYYVITF